MADARTTAEVLAAYRDELRAAKFSTKQVEGLIFMAAEALIYPLADDRGTNLRVK
ncbi:hypothetical protein ACFQ6H_27295 [Rhodococcus sp. NPDC056506]|uniref:hypothetical protein n=1 Tax=Rhodococcus sp. NPDC056506 TaxID=3345844 RepID=UPI00366DDCDD